VRVHWLIAYDSFDERAAAPRHRVGVIRVGSAAFAISLVARWAAICCGAAAAWLQLSGITNHG
jgi:hypothetical protein